MAQARANGALPAPGGRYEMPEILPRAQLRQQLRGYQIFFIVLSGIIGTTVFNTSGQVLTLAGPLGLLLALLFGGLVALCVGETVSEMVQVFPVPNAIFEYIAAWVDEDLAWTMGILYWVSWSLTFPEMLVSAAQLSTYWWWEPRSPWPPLVFFFLVPCLLVVLNLFPVYVYGWIETIGGLLKVLLVFSVTCILYDISQKNGTGFISETFKNNQDFASSPFEAFCYAVPILMLGFMGVESTTVAAYEARSRRDIGIASMWLHWIIYLLYFLCTMGIILTVSWTNQDLQDPFGGKSIKLRSTPDNFAGKTGSPTVLAIKGVNPALAGVANGCLIFSVLSAANSALYYASRALYGFTYNLPETHLLSRRFRGLSLLMESSGAPGRAILFTFIAFCWIPFLSLTQLNSIETVLQIMSLVSTLTLVLVWLALLVAFLRYKAWTTLCADKLVRAGYGRYVRNSLGYRQMARNYLLTIQPAIAWIGILGCILIFVFASAMWWRFAATSAEIFTAYGAHMVALVLLIGIKAFRGRLTRWGVPLSPDGIDLRQRIKRLEFLSNKNESRNRGNSISLELNVGNTGRVDQDVHTSPVSSPFPGDMQGRREFNDYDR